MSGRASAVVKTGRKCGEAGVFDGPGRSSMSVDASMLTRDPVVRARRDTAIKPLKVLYVLSRSTHCARHAGALNGSA